MALFGPGNSLTLIYDVLEGETLDAFEVEIGEAKKYYEAVLLSELVEKQKKGKTGFFSICFKQARKNFELNVLPILMEYKLPCTLFIQPECIGTNRLPLQEEIAWFKKEFPEQITDEEMKSWETLISTDHAKAEETLSHLRKKLGALPVHKIGPELYSMKWGALVDFNPKQFEFGLYLSSQSLDWIRESKQYAESQLSRPVTTVYRAETLAIPEEKLQDLGFIGGVTDCVGAVEKGKSAFNLPQWRF